MDIVCIAALHPRQVHFLGKKELWTGGFINWLYSRLGAIPIERGTPDIKAIKTVLAHLKKKKTICIFPEGTRNKTGNSELLEISSGISMFAIKSRQPIMPMIFLRGPTIFKRNILLCGDAFYLNKFYERPVNAETLEEANKIVSQKMKEVKQVLDYFVTLKGKERKEMKKELAEYRMPFSEIYKKYLPKFNEITVVAK
jgi:1-acyl-sn-glycerol-3-phosphate acyltransferase